MRSFVEPGQRRAKHFVSGCTKMFLYSNPHPACSPWGSGPKWPLAFPFVVRIRVYALQSSGAFGDNQHRDEPTFLCGAGGIGEAIRHIRP